MDLGKMGEFIRTQRKAQGLTQKELAEHLFKSEQAVSKWERGLCAPDLATLEPLAELLNVTIRELIAGERTEAPTEYAAQEVKEALAYSQVVMKQEVQGMRKKHVVMVMAALAVVALVVVVLWWRGAFQVMGRAKSPDGTMTATVYEGDMFYDRLSTESVISIGVSGAVTKQALRGDNYTNCQGIYWSPDSTKFVVCMERGGINCLLMENVELNTSVDLVGEIDIALPKCELGEYTIDAIEYTFLRWGEDSVSVLVSYLFRENAGSYHEGYLWFNSRTEEIHGVWDEIALVVKEDELSEEEDEVEDPRRNWPDLTGTLEREPLTVEGEDITGERLFCEEEDAAIQYMLENNWQAFSKSGGENEAYLTEEYTRDTKKEVIFHYKEAEPSQGTVFDVSAKLERNELCIDMVRREATSAEDAETEVTVAFVSKWTILSMKVTVDGEVVLEDDLSNFGLEYME